MAVTLAAINDLDVYVFDTVKAYFNAPCCDKIWKISGPYFGSDEGRTMLIIREICGLKSGGTLWSSMLANKLVNYGLGYMSSEADKDACIKTDFLPNGKTYYSMIPIDVDGILVVFKGTSVEID